MPSFTHVTSVAVVYGIAAGALIAYNIKWKHLFAHVSNKPKTLPITVVEGTTADDNDNKTKRRPIVVLLHGMWHDASCFESVQRALQERGYTSYAVDLLAGERLLPGFTQSEIVRDLEYTLSDTWMDDTNNDIVWLGHSQGGLVVQSLLKNGSDDIRKRTRGVVLLGTFPLGKTIPFYHLMTKEPRNMFGRLGYLGICGFGKLFSVDYIKHIFLLPTTDENSLQEYTTKLLEAPPDGFVTSTHFPQDVGILSTKPTLVLGARGDIIYPPHLLVEDFNDRFPNATHTVIPNQAHCFMDPKKDGEDSVESALVKWLDTTLC